jgi:hypothetical protein
MASLSYSLVNLSRKEYTSPAATNPPSHSLVNVYALQKGGPSRSHVLITANLPLIWKMCNGAGMLSGKQSSIWELGEGLLNAHSDLRHWQRQRAVLEGIISRHVDDGVVRAVCLSLAKLDHTVRDPESRMQVFMDTVPSDWLLALCYAVYKMPVEERKPSERLRNIYAEIKAAIYPASPSKQQRDVNK